MPLVDVTLKLSEEIACGLVDGRYQLFGSVVRDNAGRVVTMLEPVVRRSARAARSNPKVALAAVAVAGAAGAAVYVGSRFTRKARLTRELAKVDRTIQKTLTEHPRELTRDDLMTIRGSIDHFLTVSENQQYDGVILEVSADARRMLVAFTEALQSFSSRMNKLGHQTEPVPELKLAPDTGLLSILEAMRTQLDYQARNWPGI
ncbi:MAG TPA: hypothetical protein VFW87_18025 [Pirellulales bacterium]|nr:hypothetical protein [Pirellulales bacterium]